MMARVVYFLTNGRAIKIGYTANLERRLEVLRAVIPDQLILIGTIPGSKKLEAWIHARLSSCLVKGEWFRDCVEVRSTIDLLKSDPSLQSDLRSEELDDCCDERPSPLIGASRPLPEDAASLKELSEPWTCGDRVNKAIGRAARIAGLSYWRAFDIWYGKARLIGEQERAAIARALQIKRLPTINNMDFGMRALDGGGGALRGAVAAVTGW